jgi:hypothetical protein
MLTPPNFQIYYKHIQTNKPPHSNKNKDQEAPKEEYESMKVVMVRKTGLCEDEYET